MSFPAKKILKRFSSNFTDQGDLIKDMMKKQTEI